MERNIFIKREELTKKINDISEDLIEQVKGKKKKFLDDAKNISITELKERIVRNKIECLDKFRLLGSSTRTIQDIQEQQQKNLNELLGKITEFDELKKKIENNEFSSKSDFDLQMFGHLVEKIDFLVKINQDDVCEIWNLETNTCIKKFNPIDEIKPIKLLSYQVIEQTNLLALCDDGFFRVFDLKSGELLKKFGDSNLIPTNSKLFSNGKLKILEYEGGMNFYHLETGDLVKTWDNFGKLFGRGLKLPNKKDFHLHALLGNGNILCTFGSRSNQRTVHLIDFNTGNKVKSFVGHTYAVEHIKLLSNRYFASGARFEVKNMEY